MRYIDDRFFQLLYYSMGRKKRDISFMEFRKDFSENYRLVFLQLFVPQSLYSYAIKSMVNAICYGLSETCGNLKSKKEREKKKKEKEKKKLSQTEKYILQYVLFFSQNFSVVINIRKKKYIHIYILKTGRVF